MNINALSNLKHLKAYATLNDSVNCSKLGETMLWQKLTHRQVFKDLKLVNESTAH